MQDALANKPLTMKNLGTVTGDIGMSPVTVLNSSMKVNRQETKSETQTLFHASKPSNRVANEAFTQANLQTVTGDMGMSPVTVVHSSMRI